MPTKVIAILSTLILLPNFSFAANITNDIQGVGPSGSIKPYLCIQNSSGNVTLKLAPGMSGDGNTASGNAYYVGATIRFNGCTTNDSYLGYVGFSLNQSGNNAINSYTPPQGVHVTYSNPNIDSSGHVTGSITYSPIAVNSSLPQAETNTSPWLFTGINLSGMEFGKVIEPIVIPNLSKEDANGGYSDLADTSAFIKAGINTIRVPISWSYMQMDGPGKGALSDDYYDDFLHPLLATLTQAKVYAIVDLHAYMRYSTYGEQYSGCGSDGKCPDGQLILDSAAYKSVWGQLLDKMQADSSIDMDYIMIDLVNEPVDVPDDKVFTIQADLINMLRNKSFNGYILVEGNNWTGLHSWTTTPWTGSDGQVYTNATLFTRNNFAKAGITDLSHIAINVHQYLDSDYSGTHSDCQQDLTTTGANGFNLNAFVDYLNENKLQAIVTEFGTGKNESSCMTPLTQFMQYLSDNTAKNKEYGFIGWTIWSTGHGWGNYNLRVTPTSYHMKALKM
ncbi:MAG: cellulase family glycosylhydrolase [Legionellaceae bacterium]|nr:cellulase family glycosylhydrolase [Legionellaceae bacterium]